MTKFKHTQQLFGGNGLTALDAYNAGAGVEDLVRVHAPRVLEMLQGDEATSAFDAVLLAAENLAKWAAALAQTARRIQDTDDFDWHAAEAEYGDIYRRYQVMSRIETDIDNNVS